MVEAADDLILKILIGAGVLTIVLHMITEEEKNLAWIDGAAILTSVAVVVIVTAINDLKKEQEFQKLNEEAEKGKKITIVRDGQEISDMQFDDVVVGDLLELKAGNEIPADGILVEGFSLTIDESPMTGETKPMKKEILGKCLKKKQQLQKDGIEKLKHDSIPSVVLMAGT